MIEATSTQQTYTNLFDRKIKSLDEVGVIVQQDRAQGRSVVHCHGVFDLLHPGHIRHLHEAKQQGDVLVVTITPDQLVNKGPGRPVFNQRLRAEWLSSIEFVDYVAVNRWPSAVETIRLLRPHVFVKGSEFSNRSDDRTGHIGIEEQAIDEIGGRLHLTSDVTFSSSQLLNEHFSNLPPASDAFLKGFRKRHSSDELTEILDSLSDLRVAVVGDAIVDEYHFCETLGQCSKSNAINARFVTKEAHAGGALAVANHVAGFAKDVHLVSCLGEQDSQEETISSRLKRNVSTGFFFRRDSPTTVKRRFLSQPLQQPLFALSFMKDSPISGTLETDVCKYIERVIPEFDLVIACDFGHGFFGGRVISAICERASFLALNVQTNSANRGFNPITKFPRADFASLDENELRLACLDRFGCVKDMAEQLARTLNTSTLAVTLGRSGSLIQTRGGARVEVPILSEQVKDTTGAGDAYLAISSLCVAKRAAPEVVGFLGNCAGALAVRYVGNQSSIEPVPLHRTITALLK